MYTCILEQTQIQNVYLCVTPPLRTAKSSGVRSRTSFPAAAPAARCHATHRGHMCAISQVNPSFSRVGAPREQQQLHKKTHFHALRLCKCATA